MTMGKGYLPLFFDTFEETQDLTDEEFGRLIRAIGLYTSGSDNWEEKITGNERYAFRFLRGQVDRNLEIREARAQAGRSKKEQQETNENKPEQNETKIPKEKEEEKEKDNKKESKEPQKRFTPPTLEEVTAYCKARKNNVDPQTFIAFYASKGWKVGNQPMKDWRSCVITWEKRDRVPTKKVVAQDYTQRDAVHTEEDIRKNMLAMMREAGVG